MSFLYKAFYKQTTMEKIFWKVFLKGMLIFQ